MISIQDCWRCTSWRSERTVSSLSDSKCHTDWCYKCKFYIFVIPTNCTCSLIIFCDITVISSTFPPTQAIFREKTNTKEYIFDMKCHRECSFIPLACAECDGSLPFSGASSIPLCYVPFPAILLRQLFFHPPSPHLAIYFLVYLSILLFPNSYTGCFTTLGHNCRRWFPRSLWWKKFI